MSTKISNVFTINGTIDTNQSAMQNMQALANAVGCWVTYDVNQGKWAVVINQAGSSVKSFNDSNILGSINIRGTGIYELYNKAEISFPNKDILDQKDVITVSIPEEARFQNEIDNTLNFSNELVNDPIQAELLTAIELKQSRVDKIIEFRTDFTSIGLTAGDLIDVTNSAYDYDHKMFRILSISEEDAEDGSIVLSITAFEYDANVYSTSGLERTASSIANQIGSECRNTAVQGSNAEAALPGNLAGALGVVSLFNAATRTWNYFNGRSTTLAGTSAIITWTFRSPGEDLDIRARLLSPYLGQSVVDDYVGWTGASSTSQWPTTGTPVLVWGGDNTGTGEEQVLVDINTILAYYPNEQYVIVECRGNWYTVQTDRPVNLSAQIYQGGSYAVSSPNVTVSGYSATASVTGLDAIVYSDANGVPGETTLGDLIGFFVYDRVSGQSFIVNDLSALGF